jgi:hypothetical protein
MLRRRRNNRTDVPLILTLQEIEWLEQEVERRIKLLDSLFSMSGTERKQVRSDLMKWGLGVIRRKRDNALAAHERYLFD